MSAREKFMVKAARIQGICDYLEAKKIPYHHADVFRHERVSSTTGWKMLRSPREPGPPPPETRGRKKKLTEEDLDALQALIVKNGYDSQFRWKDLMAEAGLQVDVSGETVRRRLKARGIWRPGTEPAKLIVTSPPN